MLVTVGRPDGTGVVPGAAAGGDVPGVPGEFAPSWPALDFFGRPRPGPGRRVMGFRVGSRLLELALAFALGIGMDDEAPFEPGLESDLACALRSPWKC